MPTITVSQTLLPRLREEAGDSVWGVVPNGIDTRVYFPDSNFPRDGIGAVYNTHSNKAPEDMAWVLKRLNELEPRLSQRVFGAEACPPSLAFTDYHCLPSLEKARELYSRSRVWLLTSLTEGLPGVVLEAMACGCVVVSSDNEGSLEILRHDHNALIVPRGDREGYVRAVQRLLTDEALHARLLEQSLLTIKSFTWERAADRMEAFLRDAPEIARTCPD